MTDACRRGRDIRHFPLNIGKNSQISLVGEVPPHTIDQREARKIYSIKERHVLWHSRKLNCQSKLYVSFPGCPPGFEISISYAKKYPWLLFSTKTLPQRSPGKNAVQSAMSFEASDL